MLNSKQRAFLRGLANRIDTILIVGKGEITDNIIKQADDALTAREIIKGKVLENSAYSSREAAEAIAEKCSADVVQVIGSKFVLTEETMMSLLSSFQRQRSNYENRCFRRNI